MNTKYKCFKLSSLTDVFKKKMTFLMTDFITDPLVMVKPRTKMIITER